MMMLRSPAVPRWLTGKVRQTNNYQSPHRQSFSFGGANPIQEAEGQGVSKREIYTSSLLIRLTHPSIILPSLSCSSSFLRLHSPFYSLTCLCNQVPKMTRQSAKDDDAWEQAEGVPRLEDQFIQKYLLGRDSLIAQEKKQRSGW